MKNIWLDGIMGVAIGDALGLPVQFMNREELSLNPVTEMLPCDLFYSPVGTWSDDTAMTMGIYESIKRLGYVDAEDIMKNFMRWMYEDDFSANGRCIDLGNTCWYGIENYKKGKDIYSCGKTGEHANGNGSLMRTLPVCIFYAQKVKAEEVSIDEAIKNIHIISALTHNHLRACIACGLYYFCVYSILFEEGSLLDRLQLGINNGYDYYKKEKYNLIELIHYRRIFNLKTFLRYPVDNIRSTGYVVDTLEAAIWSLITTNNYRDAMIKAVNLGDDTDTVAAIAGGLAGLYYGYDNIPETWLNVLRRRKWIENMCK